MTKRNISIALLVLMIVSNVYLIWRVNSNTMAIASYDAGISQRNGVGRFDSAWTKFVVGTSKDSALSYEDKVNAEADSNHSIFALFILDIVLIGAIFKLNQKPKPVKVPLTREEEWERERRMPPSRRRR